MSTLVETVVPTSSVAVSRNDGYETVLVRNFLRSPSDVVAEKVFNPITGDLFLDFAARPVDPADIGPSLYPHIFDENEKAGQVVRLFRQAFDLSSTVVEGYQEADLLGVDRALTRIGAILAVAYPETVFNSALAGLTSFVRRSVLFTSRDAIDISSALVLQRVLNRMSSDPMMSLDVATDLSLDLEDCGWEGDNQALSALVQSLIADPETAEVVRELISS